MEIALSKYLDQLPLKRQVWIIERQGLTVSSRTLWDRIEAVVGHLEPSYEALENHTEGSGNPRRRSPLAAAAGETLGLVGLVHGQRGGRLLLDPRLSLGQGGPLRTERS